MNVAFGVSQVTNSPLKTILEELAIFNDNAIFNNNTVVNNIVQVTAVQANTTEQDMTVVVEQIIGEHFSSFFVDGTEGYDDDDDEINDEENSNNENNVSGDHPMIETNETNQHLDSRAEIGENTTRNTQQFIHDLEINRLKEKLNCSQNNVCLLRQRNKDLEASLKKTLSEIDPLKLIHYNYTLEQLLEFILKASDKISRQKNQNPYKMSRDIIDTLSNADMLGGNLFVAIKEAGRDYYRENVFSSHQMMKTLDMNGGQHSYQGIALMRQLEINGEKNQRNTIIPSTSAIQRAGHIVDQYANAVVPFMAGPLEDSS
jgi:hypothetical protein